LPDWHPIMQAREYEPGHWVMFDARDQPAALIRFVRRGDELGYRVVSWAQDSADRELIGYYRTLRAATMAAHQHIITAPVPRGAINGYAR
jgi:hypothetical protein